MMAQQRKSAVHLGAELPANLQQLMTSESRFHFHDGASSCSAREQLT